MRNIPQPIRLMGVPGSPYTRKMLAVLRYRRIAYELIIGSQETKTDLPSPKVKLLPIFYLPGENGQLEACVDSTPLIRHLENAFSTRKIVPSDPALAFIDELLEDYADEWLTKAMFHYRWHYKDDIAKGAAILPRWTIEPRSENTLAQMGAFISERQISRLYVVGSSDATAPIIEKAFERYLDVMKTHLEAHSFTLGARPSSCDFAAYGQLTQLAQFDPTPMKLVLDQAPRIFAWVDIVDDLSGLEVREEDWFARDHLPETLRPLLCEVGRVYAPVMLANALALKDSKEQVETEIDGKVWTQQPFPYQAKCLNWLNESYRQLKDQDRAFIDELLADTGCLKLFNHPQ